MTDKFSISRNNLRVTSLFMAGQTRANGDSLFLNPKLFQNCTNLLADTYYCVQPVGYIVTYSGYGESSTSTVPFDETPSTSLPSQPPMAWSTGSNPIIPLANGTRTDCTQYMWFSGVNLTENTAADCWNQAWLWNASDEEIILWNPSLASNETSSSSSVSASLLLCPTRDSHLQQYLQQEAETPIVTPLPISDWKWGFDAISNPDGHGVDL
ncbi:uncharacterized protein N7477_005275 [Penicillium maclennaniae]|uniref:uncharacterized protein n=1 Tax=Penicillium maclennaniae TaxID=1343394 RepID=UPI00254241B4|nr:uncharacterized protein N7477_005275 [Penicillium maclennaniae]KAJ5669912.1 hypothetical protein N7477_005275 [Penicillium maclennaniae]